MMKYDVFDGSNVIAMDELAHTIRNPKTTRFFGFGGDNADERVTMPTSADGDLASSVLVACATMEASYM